MIIVDSKFMKPSQLFGGTTDYKKKVRYISRFFAKQLYSSFNDYKYCSFTSFFGIHVLIFILSAFKCQIDSVLLSQKKNLFKAIVLFHV